MAVPIPVTYNGKQFESYTALAKYYGIKYSHLMQKRKQGLTIDQCMNELLDVDDDIQDYDQYITKNKKESEISFASGDQLVSADSLALFIEANLNLLKHINIIDFESACERKDILLPYIENPSSLNILFYDPCEYSNECYKLLKPITRNVFNLHMIQQITDDKIINHMISHCLGILSTKEDFKNMDINIITRDPELYPFIKMLQYTQSNINIIDMGPVFSKEDKFRYCLYKYIIKNKVLQDKQYCIEYDEFITIFEDFCRDDKITKNFVDDLIFRLINWRALEVEQDGEYKIYNFKLKTIQEFMDNFN